MIAGSLLVNQLATHTWLIEQFIVKLITLFTFYITKFLNYSLSWANFDY